MKMIIALPWTNVHSSTFDMDFEKACFEKLGYCGWCIARPSAFGCEFSCGAYDENQEDEIRRVFDEVCRMVKGE